MRKQSDVLRPPSFFEVTAKAIQSDPEYGRMIMQKLSPAEKAGVLAIVSTESTTGGENGLR